MTSAAFDPVTADPTPQGGRVARTGWSAWRGLVLENLAVLVVFALAGALAGWLWERWATPPTGVALDGEWILGARVDGDFLVRDPEALGHAFGVVGTFAVVCGVTGLILGVVAAYACRRSELVTLAVVAVSSVVAVFLCYRIGLSLGPVDPTAAAATADNGAALTGSLAIDQRTPFVALPLGALVGLTVSYLLTTGVSAGVAGSRSVELGRPVDLPPTARHG